MSRATLTTRSKHFDVTLAKHGHAHLREALGWRVTAAHGTLWITQDGDARDVVLKAGESFDFDRPVALVSALETARARFAPLGAQAATVALPAACHATGLEALAA